MKHFVPTAVLLAVVFVGCVSIPDTFTANINVTIRHIEEQAGAFLDYVEGESDTVPDFDVDPEDKASMEERPFLDYVEGKTDVARLTGALSVPIRT